jgi:hypothetical protein
VQPTAVFAIAGATEEQWAAVILIVSSIGLDGYYEAYELFF